MGIGIRHQFHGTESYIAFTPYLIAKDGYIGLIWLFIWTMQSCYGFMTLSHPDNTLEVNALSTPAHIVPEWYFLPFYIILKSIPSKAVGLAVFALAIVSLYGK